MLAHHKFRPVGYCGAGRGLQKIFNVLNSGVNLTDNAWPSRAPGCFLRPTPQPSENGSHQAHWGAGSSQRGACPGRRAHTPQLQVSETEEEMNKERSWSDQCNVLTSESSPALQPRGLWWRRRSCKEGKSLRSRDTRRFWQRMPQTLNTGSRGVFPSHRLSHPWRVNIFKVT